MRLKIAPADRQKLNAATINKGARLRTRQTEDLPRFYAYMGQRFKTSIDSPAAYFLRAESGLFTAH
jgi:hypothetical protein